jgi:hypothetical protein
MAFRVPLILEVSLATWHRLSPSSTQDVQPYTGATGGYDKDFREPIVYDDARGERIDRDDARVELPPVNVPCQVEPVKFEKLRQRFTGDMPDSDIQLVLHKKDLRKLKLITAQEELLLKKNDRVSSLKSKKKPKQITRHLEPPGLYIFEIAPGSWGFGPDGYDLYIAFLNSKEREM